MTPLLVSRAIDSAAQAEARVASLKEKMSYRLGTLEGECVGIPELTPGRYLEIDGSDEQVKGLSFLTKVRHLFTQENYQTSFEFKGAKL